MLDMQQRKEVVSKLIGLRIGSNPSKYEYLRNKLNSLSMIEIMSFPEATIFNIVYPYMRSYKLGIQPAEIITKLEAEDQIYSPTNIHNYPKTLNEYIKFKLNQDHGAQAHEITDELIRVYVMTISTETEALDKRQSQSTSSQSKEGCYIATACYGSYNTPELLVFRNFRDTKLNKTLFGRSFIKVYYKTSPFLVKVIGDNKSINKFIKRCLDRVYVNLISKS